MQGMKMGMRFCFTVLILSVIELTASAQHFTSVPELTDLNTAAKQSRNSADSSSLSSHSATHQFAPVPGSSLSFVPLSSPSELPTYTPPPPPMAAPKRKKHHHRAPLRSALPPQPHMVSPTQSPISTPLPPTLPPISPVSPPTQSPPSPMPPAGFAPEPSKPGQSVGLWCVAKPSVPEDKLQEAMDYACGEGRANCEEIMPNGSCYYPDTVLAHASFAFNSYWQKMKHVGGSCDFNGVALLVVSDPSFENCQYISS